MNYNEIELMKHAIGLDYKNPRHYRERAYYKPYRNYFGAGGVDKTWESLVERGLAETSDHSMYRVSNKGLEELGNVLYIHIYSEYSGCVGDAMSVVLHRIMESCSGFMSYPVTSRNIAQMTRIPIKLVRETVNYLIEQGLVKKETYGGCTEEGTPWCIHGYGLTKKGLEHPYYKECCKKHDEYVADMLKGEK
jgi:hypothetical protein